MKEKYGYPVLSIDRPYAVGTSGQLRTRIQAFVESLEIKRINAGKEIINMSKNIGSEPLGRFYTGKKAEEKKRMARIEGYMVRLCKVAWILEDFNYIYNKT